MGLRPISSPSGLAWNAFAKFDEPVTVLPRCPPAVTSQRTKVGFDAFESYDTTASALGAGRKWTYGVPTSVATACGKGARFGVAAGGPGSPHFPLVGAAAGCCADAEV